MYGIYRLLVLSVYPRACHPPAQSVSSFVLFRLNVRHWPPEKGVMSKPTAMDHVGKRGNRLVRHKEGKDITSPRVVILADSLNQLPRAMRLGGAVIFTNVSSPDARGYAFVTVSYTRRISTGTCSLSHRGYLFSLCSRITSQRR